MKRIALFLISFTVFLIFSQTTNAQSNKKSDAEIEGLRGKVMSVKEKAYIENTTIFFGLIPVKNVFSDTYTLYNKDGDLVSNKQINGLAENYSISLYKYDERRNLIEQIDSNYEDGISRSRIYQYTYKYDDFGNIIEENSFFDNRFVSKYCYKYDENGYCVESISYQTENDSAFCKDIYIRDKNGKNVEWKSYNKFGDFNSRLVFEYDNKDRVIKEECYNEDGKLLSKFLNKYNEKGDEIEITKVENNARDFSSYKYIYDSESNWIKQIRYKENGSIEYIIKRKIKYYKD